MRLSSEQDSVDSAELCRMTLYRSCLHVTVLLPWISTTSKTPNLMQLLEPSSTTAPAIAQSFDSSCGGLGSIRTFNFLLYSIYRSFADSLPSSC